MIGLRLRLVRDILDLTQEQLAEMIGTTQSGVASMETGIYQPSTEYLKTISAKTGFTAEFFGKGEPPDFPFGSILYRAQASVKKGPKTRAHAMAHVAFEFAVAMAEKLKRIPVNIPRLTEDPEASAQIVRASLGISPNRPIKGLLRCLERNGVIVFVLPMRVDGFDGFSAWAGGNQARPVIAIMSGKTPFREESTMAEELAHLAMHSPLRVSTRDADKEARLFAMELLLPAEAMRQEMQPPITLSSLATLKSRWGVSIAFLAKRAETLSLVTPTQYRYLAQEIRSRWAKSEPGDEAIVPTRPMLVRKMAEMIYGSPLDSAKLVKESGLPVAFLRDAMGLELATGKLLEFKR